MAQRSIMRQSGRTTRQLKALIHEAEEKKCTAFFVVHDLHAVSYIRYLLQDLAQAEKIKPVTRTPDRNSFTIGDIQLQILSTKSHVNHIRGRQGVYDIDHHVWDSQWPASEEFLIALHACHARV